MKASEDAAQELPLNDEKAPDIYTTAAEVDQAGGFGVQITKKNRHVTIALNHLRKRQFALLEKREALSKEIDEVDNAITALE